MSDGKNLGRGDVATAFARVQREIREVAAELERQFARGFTASQLSDLSWLVEARVLAGPFTGTRFWFDDTAGTIRSHPSANFARTQPSDHHTFTFDAASNAFTENGERVTDEELVERALRPFLLSMLSSS
jgi:hypothetical protein